MPDLDPAWAHHLDLAAAQLARHGHLRRAGRTTQRWADTQIRALRTGTVHPERRQRLADIGLTDRSLTTAEQRMLAELDWWIARHGDAQVPQAATSRTIDGRPYTLGKRISEARIAHGRGQLAPVMLEELGRRPGWTWRIKEDRWARMWDTQCTALEQHVHATGSLDALPTGVYRWLMRQRATLDQLPPKRRERLEAIPGALVSRDSRVADFVAAARTWLAGAPERTMAALRYADTVDVDDVTVPLGRRATYYRRRFHALEGTHPLTPAEVDLIQALPGWSWTLQERYRRARSRRVDDAVTGRPVSSS